MPCCQCCTKQRTAQIFLVLGAAVLIASFVIAAALVQVVSNALRSNAIIPTPDQSNWRDWLSNIPSQQRNGDAAATFYTFYFFNLTNLNDVALNGATPALTERGPYVYQSFSQKIESTVSYNADNSQVSYQTWSWKQFRSDLSYGNDDYNDYFILPDPVYQNAFGWAGSPFAGLPEGGARVALAPLVWGALYDRVFARLALQDGSSSRIVFSSSTTAIIHVFLGPQTISYNGGTYNSFSSLFTPLLNNVSRTRVFPTMPDIEYYRIVGTTVDTALAFAVSDLPNLGALYNNATNGIIAPVGPLASTAALVGCTDFRLLNTSSSFRCWSALPGAVVQSGQDLATTFGLMSAAIGGKFTSKQMQGLYVWLGVISGVCPLCPLFALNGVAGLTSYSTSALQLDKSWAEWALKSMGHLGRGLAGLSGTKGFTSGNNVYPTFPSTGVRFYSTGNAYVSRNPRSIAYENTNIFSGVALASSSVIDPLATGIFTNYSSPAYAMVFNYVETDGTGQKNITDADSIYRFNNFVAVGAGKTAPGTPGIRFCNSTLSFYNVQDGFTKATPRYAPGIVGTNPFSIGKSVLDKNFVIDVWSSDISRRIQLAYLNDADMSDIKLIRYNFSYPNLLVNYDLSQPFQGVLSSECSSGTVLLTLPHWQAADIFPSPATTTSMFAVGLAVKPDITYLSNAIIARDNTPPSGGDISDLQPFLDLEPYSGALMRGSLREQVNLYFSNAIPAGATNVSVSPGLEIVGMNPARYTVWPVFWVNRNGQATSKQIDTFKSGVYGVTTAATVILIVGSIIGGLTFVISFVLLVKYAREDSERTPYGTQPSSTNLNM